MKKFKTSNLIEIFQLLSPLVEKANDYELSEDLAQAKQTYTTMLHFLVKGTDDPNTPTIYAQLQTKAYDIHDRAERILRLKEMKSDKYSLTRAQLSTTPPFCSLIQVLLQQTEAIAHTEQDPNLRDTQRAHTLSDLRTTHETTLETLFEEVWTSDLWTDSDYQTASSLLEAPAADTDRCILVSAVTLALQEMFDPRKTMFLIDAYLHPSVPVNQRALVGLLLILRQWDQRIEVYPQLSARISMLTDDANFRHEFYRTMMQLQYSQLTDTISTKMQQDIIPSIMKSTKFKHTQFGLQEIDDYMTKHGENPEWHHKETDAQAQTSLEEMANLQIDGADIYMSAFSQMKNHPFFHAIGHWFMPFDPLSPLISHTAEPDNPSSKFLQIILQNSPFCDSDKYSFAFMLNHLGQHGRHQFSSNISSNLSNEEINELMQQSSATRTQPASIVSRHYIFDLYRFFQLYPYHQQFSNPFKKDNTPFSPLCTQCFQPLLDDNAGKQHLADFFMRKALYSQALDLYQSFHPQPREEDADLWQRMGFCEQKQGHHQQAYQYYSQAYRLTPQSNWTLKHLAAAALQQAAYSEANTLYDLLLAEDPDNLALLTHKATCLMHLRHYAEALPLLYKANYLNENTQELRHNLALCELLSGHPDKALTLSQQLLTDHANTPNTWFLLGTIHLAAGRISEAYHALSQALHLMQTQENSATLFKQRFIDMAHTLSTLGVNPQKVEMLYDAVTAHLLGQASETE